MWHTLGTLDISQYDYCLFVCITACIQYTVLLLNGPLLQWYPPHTLYSWLFGWCIGSLNVMPNVGQCIKHETMIACKPQWPGSKERRLLDGTIVNRELLYAYVGTDVSTVRFVCVHNTSRLQLYCKFRYRTHRRHINWWFLLGIYTFYSKYDAPSRFVSS